MPSTFESRSIGLEKNGSCSSEGCACLSWRSVPQLLCSPTRCGKPRPRETRRPSGCRAGIRPARRCARAPPSRRRSARSRRNCRARGGRSCPRARRHSRSRRNCARTAPRYAAHSALKPAIGHRLAAAGLVARIDDLVAEPLQQLERGDADFRKEGIDVAGNEEPNAHSFFLLASNALLSVLTLPLKTV